MFKLENENSTYYDIIINSFRKMENIKIINNYF